MHVGDFAVHARGSDRRWWGHSPLGRSGGGGDVAIIEMHVAVCYL